MPHTSSRILLTALLLATPQFARAASTSPTSAPVTQGIPPYKFRGVVVDDSGRPVAAYEVTEQKHATARYFRIGDTFLDGNKIVEINSEGVAVTDEHGTRVTPQGATPDFLPLPPVSPSTAPTRISFSAAPSTTSTTTPATTSQPADQLQTALYNSLVSGGVTPTAVTRQGNQCTLTATTTTARLARSLQTLETSKLPIRHDTISIQTPQPGVDNLRVVMVFTLNAAPAASIPLTDVIRDLTGFFPPGPNTIWLTSLAYDSSHQSWQIEGRCTAEKFAQDLEAAMKPSPRFLTPVLTTTPDPAKPGEFTFRLRFQYRPPLT